MGLGDVSSTRCRQHVGKTYILLRHHRDVRVRWLSWLLIVLLTSGCGTSVDQSANPAPSVVTITAEDLAPVAADVTATTDPEVNAERTVVLAEGIADILAALGLADRVVGRGMTGSSAFADVPVVAPAHTVNVEAVLAADPTLVIADSAVAPASALDQIRAAGIDVRLVPTAESFATAQARLIAVSKLFGITVNAKSWFPDAAPKQNGPRVAFLYLRGSSAIYLVGGRGSGADDVIAAAGGIDVGSQLGLGPFTPLTPETLAVTDVDVLLVMAKGLESVGGVDGLVTLPGVAQTRAAAQRRIIAVEDDVLLGFGSRTQSLISQLADVLGTQP